ncbi:hypothetical protein PR202_ga25001 [Eleusine coracana subsp. coracana]|uniref:Uncharacterized protein n=1 Tax=Eleusine coracana subsp. coracana TaxID=191504 RepID=A0AAV5D952_ELECO|nr:hypothetical protein PR202_ga25001 [Eleusine coracana subsp. coracana]
MSSFLARSGAGIRARSDLLQLPQHLPSFRPHRRRRVHAVQRELERVHELVADVARCGVAHELEVKHLAGPLLLNDGCHPLREVHAVGVVGGGLAGEELEDDDAEAVHVRLGVGLLQLGQLRRAVPQRAGGRQHVGVGGGRHEAGQPEVGDLGVVVIVEEDVAGGEVAVDDAHVVVEVRQTTGRALGDDHPCRPVHRSVWSPSCCIIKKHEY